MPYFPLYLSHLGYRGWQIGVLTGTAFLAIGLQLGHAFTFTVFHLAALQLLSRLVPPQSSPGGQALYGMVAFGVGGSTGLALAGVLVDRMGTPGLFDFEAVVALVVCSRRCGCGTLLRSSQQARSRPDPEAA